MNPALQPSSYLPGGSLWTEIDPAALLVEELDDMYFACLARNGCIECLMDDPGSWEWTGWVMNHEYGIELRMKRWAKKL